MIIRSIADLLRNRALVTITPDASVAQAATLLDEHGIGALAVMQNGRLVGLLSERDVIRRCLARRRDIDTTTVGEVMTPDPVTIRRNASLADAQAAMLDGGFRHLPVLDGAGDAVGMLSMRDIPTEYRLMVERFRDYVAPAPM